MRSPVESRLCGVLDGVRLWRGSRQQAEFGIGLTRILPNLLKVIINLNLCRKIYVGMSNVFEKGR